MVLVRKFYCSKHRNRHLNSSSKPSREANICEPHCSNSSLESEKVLFRETFMVTSTMTSITGDLRSQQRPYLDNHTELPLKGNDNYSNKNVF